MNVLTQVKSLLRRKPAPKRKAPVRAAKTGRRPALPETAASSQTTPLGGAVCVLEIAGLAQSPDADKLAKEAFSLIEWHVSSAGRVGRHGPGRYAIEFEEKDAERANIKLKQISNALLVRLRELADDIEFAVSDLAAPPLPTGTRETVDAYVTRLFGDLEAKQLAVAQEREGKLRAVRKDADCYFVPVWNVATEKTEIGRCQLDFSLRAATIKDVRTSVDPDELNDIHASHDMMALKKGLLGFYEAKRQRFAPDVLVPVSVVTLCDALRRAVYIEQIKGVGEDYRQSLILEILEPDEEFPVEQLADAIAAVSKDLDRIVLCVGKNRALLHQAVQARVWGISVDLGRMRQVPPADALWFKGVGSVCRKTRIVALAHGVSTVAVAGCAIEHGFTYIDGSAVHLAQPQMRPATRLRPFPTPPR